jgi:hypothetical protein
MLVGLADKPSNYYGQTRQVADKHHHVVPPVDKNDSSDRQK